MRKLKRFKDKKDLRSRDFIDIDSEFSLPIKSVSAVEAIQDVTNFKLKAPVRKVRLTAEEAEKFKDENPEFANTNINMLYRVVYDETDIEYCIEKEKNQAIGVLANNYMKYIDLDYKMEDGTPLWEDLELESNTDYMGLTSKLLDELGLGVSFVEDLKIKIKKMDGDVYSEKIDNLSKYLQMNPDDIVDKLVELEKNEKS